MSVIEKCVGLAIREQRRGRCMKQSELGEEIGLHQTAISRIERGTRPVTIYELDCISAACECSCSYLIGRAEDLREVIGATAVAENAQGSIRSQDTQRSMQVNGVYTVEGFGRALRRLSK